MTRGGESSTSSIHTSGPDAVKPAHSAAREQKYRFGDRASTVPTEARQTLGDATRKRLR
jgi:hypothetical protein